MIKKIIKRIIPAELVYRLKVLAYRYCGHNSIKIGKSNKFIISNAVLKNCIVDIQGRNCYLEIGEHCELSNCVIRIFGDDCKLSVGSEGIFRECTFWLEDSGSSILIGDKVRMTGKIGMGVVEGTGLTIGDDCLFSSDIQIMTTDSHSILDLSTGSRINPSKDVTIGRHVWVCRGVTIGKGVVVAANVVIGAASYVSKSVTESNSIVAGVPAKIIKRGVDWDQYRR